MAALSDNKLVWSATVIVVTTLVMSCARCWMAVSFSAMVRVAPSICCMVASMRARPAWLLAAAVAVSSATAVILCIVWASSCEVAAISSVVVTT